MIPKWSSTPGWLQRFLLWWTGVILLSLLASCWQQVAWSPVPEPTPPQPAPAPPPRLEPQLFYVAVNRLNLRACAGMDCPKIATLERNQEVEKLGESKGWFQVRSRLDGTLGWVDARYLSSTPVPVAPATPPAPIPPPVTESVGKSPAKPEVTLTPPKPAEKPAEVKAKEGPTRPGKPAVEIKPVPKQPEEVGRPLTPGKKPGTAEAAEPVSQPESIKETPKSPAPEPSPAKPAPPEEPPAKKIRIM